ncbi:MAG: glycosyltransferase [Verrucomicrobia bacterium]|nr:glycosyltransferase [Verrucomicrobiota bacterium]
MQDFLNIVLIPAYVFPAAMLMLFGANLYVMIIFFLRRRNQACTEKNAIMSAYSERFSEADLPPVVTQIPIYNEYNVAERAIRAAVEMDYPKGRHMVQVLDDSTDETRRVIDRVAEELTRNGHNIQVVRRDSREGFKAGALEHAMSQTEADFFAIFDADFVPPKDFLLRTIPVMMVREDVGLVQARWGHLNRNSSMLTRAQAVGIDGHFAIEQPARAWNSLFMNFNGTAGLWRRQAIEGAGGWEHDTLTEDMDLSYRSQLAGWKPFFLWDLVVPAELPEDINAFKSQQFRWAKGSMQTAIKLLPRVFASDFSVKAKIEAVFHMVHYCIHPLMMWLAIMTLPVLILTDFGDFPPFYRLFFALVLLSMIAPTILYAVSQSLLYPGGWSRIKYLPFLTAIGTGIAVSNSRAVWQAIRGKQSDFIRTPKQWDKPVVQYHIRMPLVPVIEIALGIYSFISLSYYLQAQKYMIGPFLLLYACGFTTVGLLSLAHMKFRSGRQISWPSLAHAFRTPRRIFAR